MPTSIEIFARVNDYVERRMTLRQLESWLTCMLPTYLSNSDSSAAQLAGTIQLGLAEIRAGIRTERSLKKLLSHYIAYNPIRYEMYPHQTSINETTSSGSLTEPTTLDWLDLSPSWSTEPQVESV